MLQPAWEAGAEVADARECIARSLEDATGLRTTKHRYANWIGLDCSSVSSAITTLRRIVASNILCRREGTAILLPLNPIADPHGARLAHSVAELLARDA